MKAQLLKLKKKLNPFPNVDKMLIYTAMIKLD